MNQFQINNAIVAALDNIYTLSEMLYNVWYNELYCDGSPIESKFTEQTLALIEHDVMSLSVA